MITVCCRRRGVKQAGSINEFILQLGVKGSGGQVSSIQIYDF